MPKPSDEILSEDYFEIIKRRSRVLVLLDAAERAGITPLSTPSIHALAYLADVLSPVWNLPAFTNAVLKIAGGPFYRDLQTELDRLVVQGLVEVSSLTYTDRPRGGARIDGLYGLTFEAPELESILAALGARSIDDAIDPRDFKIHSFLVELARAFATLSSLEMERAVAVDVSWHESSTSNLVDMDRRDKSGVANFSVETADRFSNFVPDDVHLNPSEKIYLYAAYLGRRVYGN